MINLCNEDDPHNYTRPPPENAPYPILLTPFSTARPASWSRVRRHLGADLLRTPQALSSEGILAPTRHHQSLGSRPEQAARFLQAAADNGDFKAQSQMISLFRNGIGVETCPSHALLFTMKAALQGDASAAFEYGCLYESGSPHLAQDKRKAMEWFRKCGPRGKRRLIKVLEDLTEGEGFSDTSEEERIAAMLELESIEEARGDSRKAARWVEAAAEAGHISSQISVAHRYDTGKGVDESGERMVFWLRRAAKKDLDAACMLGKTYITGRGHDYADLEKAFQWLRICAEKHHAAANFELGIIMYKGHGVGGPNMEEAMTWMQRAADLGSVQAKEKLRRWKRTSIAAI